MPSKVSVVVTLRGLTFSGRVWNEGDQVALSDLPTSLRKAVKAGKHPHLALIAAEKATAASEPDEKAAAT